MLEIYVNKSFIEKMIMLACQKCNTPLNQTGDKEFIVRCRNCSWVNRFRYEVLEEEKLIKDAFDNPIMFKKQVGGGVLYTYPFDLRYLIRLKGSSLKFGEAVEKFIFYDKDKLSASEKNLLYKLKAQSIPEIDDKIQYLEAKKKCIELLRLLEF